MELGDIKGWVRTLLEDDEYDGDTIMMAANWFVYELFNNTRTRLMESSDTFSFLAGATTADFPDDMMNMIGIYVTSPAVQEITDFYIPYKNFMANYANFATAASGSVHSWTDFNNQMRLTSPAIADSSGIIDYLREPVAMEVDSDTCEVPKRYQELVAKGTLARVMEINEDYSEAAQERDNMEPLRTAFIRNEARGGLKIGAQKVNTSMANNRRGWNASRDF